MCPARPRPPAARTLLIAAATLLALQALPPRSALASTSAPSESRVKTAVDAPASTASREPPRVPALLLAQASGDSPTESPRSEEATNADKPRSARSIFLSLFATHFVPTIATSLANWLTARSFGPQPGAGSLKSESASPPEATAKGPEGAPTPPSTSTPAPVAARNAAEPRETPAEVHAGIAYKVWAISRDGRRHGVDPSRHVFNTGDRFELEFRPNFPGRVAVYNQSPGRDDELIDQVVLDISDSRHLGPYEFDGKPGEELLRIVLHPCFGGAGQAASRSIRRAQLRPDIAQALADCDAPASGATQVATRSIRKATREGEAGLALDPVSRAEIADRRIAPREITLRFLHR